MTANSSDDERRYIRVTCPTCRALLHPRVEHAGRHVRCPDCYAAVLVPQPPPPEPPAKPRRDPGEYKVSGAEQPPERSDVFVILCPTCRARLSPRLSFVGKRVRCPDCEAVIVVPAPPPPEKAKQQKSPGQYRMGVEPARAEVRQELLLVQSERPVEPAEQDVPRLWFASGVLLFPWKLSSLPSWTALSVFLVPLGALLGIGAYLMSGLNLGSMVLAILIVPIVCAFVWSMSYAAACAMGIMQDTVAGLIEVEQWPEGSVRDRMGPMVYIAFEFFIGAAAAAGPAWLVGLAFGPLWSGVALAALTAFTFPFFLLSALEADTPLTPYSPVILGSVVKLWWAWLLVAVESLIVVGLFAGLTALSGLASPFAIVLVGAPALASAMFIIARLYGRLAWRIGEWEAEKRRRKKKKKKVPVQDAAATSE